MDKVNRYKELYKKGIKYPSYSIYDELERLFQSMSSQEQDQVDQWLEDEQMDK